MWYAAHMNIPLIYKEEGNQGWWWNCYDYRWELWAGRNDKTQYIEITKKEAFIEIL